MNLLLAIDPGPEESGWVIIDMDTDLILRDGPTDCNCFGHDDNHELLAILEDWEGPVVCEMVGNYGKGFAVGASVFETCIWIGRFQQVIGDSRFRWVVRATVAANLCGVAAVSKPVLTQAIRDRYRERHKDLMGGGATPEKGTKKAPGPLYGMSNHIWSALAVALYFVDWPDTLPKTI